MEHSIVERVGVVGAGTMGAGIAEFCLMQGLSVTVAVSCESRRTGADLRILSALERRVSRGRITAADRDAAAGRLTVTAGLDALADRQLIIEAIPEDQDLKRALFAQLDAVTGADTVLASTTSAISIAQLAAATTHPERVLGVHFFNPVAALPLVELIPTLRTLDEVTERVRAFVTGTLGKNPIEVADRSGFVVNALLIPYLLAAVRLVESGVCDVATVDLAMKQGCAHPMGPLRLADLIGLDVVVAIANALYQEFKEPLYAAPPTLLRLVESGFLGRKTGRGFHPYDDRLGTG